MEINVYDLSGNASGSIQLPRAFETPFRPDVIRKAVSVSQANRRQPYGASPMAGRWRAVEGWGPGRGVSRVPRLTQGRRAAFAPHVRGGRRAHPPTAEKKLDEKINKKERRLALRSALAATADTERVADRGHRFDLEATPLVVEDALLDIGTTQELLSTLETLGVAADVQRAKEGTKVRAGKGKLRGRRLKVPRSLLLVVHEEGPVTRAASNLPGVEFTTPDQLNVERLAPGGDAGRLTLFTQSALEATEEVAK